jgi:cytosine/adenosine deaminase-related metal-dependent hydrolase
VALDASNAAQADILIADGRIQAIEPLVADRSTRRETHSSVRYTTLDLSGLLVLPGLINAHDHLEFNLLPRLGKGPYPNYQCWAEDVYHPERSPLREHLMVPKHVRLWWGGIKNLISGVTTVCHHNSYDSAVFDEGFPLHVVKRCAWAHSIRFDRDLVGRYRAAPAGVPFLIHAGEGTDGMSELEVFELDRLGVLDSRTVVVHAVGFTPAGRALLEERGGGVVWCPTSNIFTLGKTLDKIAVLQHRRIALGSDSALTGQGDLLDEIRAAHWLTNLDAERIYQMVTTGAAEVLQLKEGEGMVRTGAPADLIGVPDRGESPARTLAKTQNSDIALVVVDSRVRMVSPILQRQWPAEELKGLERIIVGGTERFVRAPVRRLLDETRHYVGSEISLAGRSLTA